MRNNCGDVKQSSSLFCTYFEPEMDYKQNWLFVGMWLEEKGGEMTGAGPSECHTETLEGNKSSLWCFLDLSWLALGIEQKLSFDPPKSQRLLYLQVWELLPQMPETSEGERKMTLPWKYCIKREGTVQWRKCAAGPENSGEQWQSRKHKGMAECCHLTGWVLQVLHHYLLSPLQLPGSLSPVPRLSITHCTVLCPPTLPCLQTRVTTALELHQETGDLRFALYSLLCDLGYVT